MRFFPGLKSTNMPDEVRSDAKRALSIHLTRCTLLGQCRQLKLADQVRLEECEIGIDQFLFDLGPQIIAFVYSLLFRRVRLAANQQPHPSGRS